MKVFEFPLDKVLNYKEQIENNLKSRRPDHQIHRR